MLDKRFPRIHYYDQDFVDLYEKTWAWLEDFWQPASKKAGYTTRFFNYPEAETINQFDSIFATFFLVYSNRVYPAMPLLDTFYRKQEKSGAIRGEYSVTTGKPVFSKNNPEGIHPPLFAWAEYNLYHKNGLKKRIKDIIPILERYIDWVETTFKDENGLYHVPVSALMMGNAPLKNAYYSVGFNSQVALNALYMSALGEILNDKELSFKYKKQYFSLKTRINSKMWNEDEGFYYDLDKNEQQLSVKSINAFWPMLAEMPNEDKAETIVEHLKNPEDFGTETPFPSIAANEESFSDSGKGYNGSVFTHYTFMVIKGLEKYGKYDLARECAIRHLYNIVDVLHPEADKKGDLWEAYKPHHEGPAEWKGKKDFPRKRYLTHTALATVTLMIENIVGLYISLPRKTVDWIVPTLELMGIENLSLKRNLITILSNKSGRGWEIRLESEKLYYFTINVLGKKKKTLPIPSGKCSMLIDKL